ncbi:PE family protein [Mycobacterium terramassiliense]|uniref:PE family protein n=1 Tax=Mycobacterium terramassiliense TaxID=1841859 RepID=A0A2U3NJL6_9MYCO|nr:PE family protein [Mycobacterium terramassiliense]SPM31737.1 PE family protein [Mycobacterium terramassiliense]
MSYVIATPELMTSAATDLAAAGANVNAAHMVAAAPTVAVIPAAADEVSASVAQLFSQHAANYQGLAGQAAAFQEQFVQHLTAGAFSYADVEATLASLLQGANGVVSVIATSSPQQLIEDLVFPLISPIFNNPELVFPLLVILGAPPFLAAITFLLLYIYVAGLLNQYGL